jgi:hypothetical protein
MNPLFTLNLEYTKPIIGMYETIDNDPNVRLTMTNYYYDLIRDDWLLDELNDILNYFIYQNGKVEMIKKIDEYKSSNISNDTDKIAEEKVKYLTKNLFNRYNLIEALTQFTKETQTKWVNLPKNELYLRKFIRDYLMKEIRRKIKND